MAQSHEQGTGLVARLLAGDQQAMRLLELLREFTLADAEAFLRCGERIADGMPVAEAARLMYRECGHSDAEATELLKVAPREIEPAGFSAIACA